MAKIIFQAKKYANRTKLEEAIQEKTTIPKKNVEIKGSRKELKRLHLSARNTVWGIKVVEIDPLLEQKVSKRPQRGKKHKSGINLGGISKSLDLNKLK